MVAPESRSVLPGLLDSDLTHHLADNDLNVLVIDVNALLTVDLLDLAGDIAADALTAELIVVNAADAQDLMRVERAGGELLTLIDMVAIV